MALQLYRTFNYQTPTQDWLNINYNSVLTSRPTRFGINKSCRFKIGMNIVSNRFNYLNGKIDLNLLNLTYGTYKTHCKHLFLVWSSFPDDFLHVIQKLKWQVSSCWSVFAKHIPLTIPLMYNLVHWNNFIEKYIKESVAGPENFNFLVGLDICDQARTFLSLGLGNNLNRRSSIGILIGETSLGRDA